MPSESQFHEQCARAIPVHGAGGLVLLHAVLSIGGHCIDVKWKIVVLLGQESDPTQVFANQLTRCLRSGDVIDSLEVKRWPGHRVCRLTFTMRGAPLLARPSRLWG